MILCFSDRWQDTRCEARCKQKYFMFLRKYIYLKYIAKIIKSICAYGINTDRF